MGSHVDLAVSRFDGRSEQAAHALRRILGPLHRLLDLIQRAHLGNHHAAATGFHRPHHRGVVGRRHPGECVEADRPAGHQHHFQLGVRNGSVLLIDPQTVEVAEDAGHLDQLGTREARKEHHADQLAIAKPFDNRVGHNYGMPSALRDRKYGANNRAAVLDYSPTLLRSGKLLIVTQNGQSCKRRQRPGLPTIASSGRATKAGRHAAIPRK